MSESPQCTTCGAGVTGGPNFCPSCGSSLQEPGPTGEAKLSGLHVGGFVLGEPIRTGKVGELYLARHESLGKQVVVKLLHAQLLGESNRSRRFRREALAASRLNHPNVIHVLDFGQLPNGRLYLAMEYVEGIDLAELLHRDGPLPPRRIVMLLRQICCALDEAHSNGVLHRDLKPENIMVGDRPNMRDHVKVVDFGIAKVAGTSRELASVQSIGGLFCGTPEYMSPEQARGGDVDRRSDLYSLGVILYQLLVGEVPFQDPSALGVITKHLSQAPVWPEERQSEIQPELAALAMRLLSKEPEQRLPSAMDVVTELDYIESLLTGSSSPSSTTERDAATLSDIPQCDTTEPHSVSRTRASSATQPELSTANPTAEEPSTLWDTDEEMPVTSADDMEGRETSPGDEMAAATQDVPMMPYPTTSPIKQVGMQRVEFTRTWVTGLLLAVAIFLLGWLVFRIWPNPPEPAGETPAGETDRVLTETPPEAVDDQ